MSDVVTETAGGSVAITGAGGLVGSALSHAAAERGLRVQRLVRRTPESYESEIQWDPQRGLTNPDRLEGVGAVVHLAGENIAGGRWTEQRKQRIRDSRVVGRTTLARSLAGLQQPPRVMVCASAVGIYGDRGDELLDEASPPGSGFLADVCREWEQATEPAAAAGIRVVNLRIGLVLSRRGGALQAMLLPFKLGVGGRVGSGRQYWSWIALDDLVGAILHAIDSSQLGGPVNAVSPNPATNAEFTKTLGRVLGRPTIVPLPAFAAKLVLGQMAQDLLLASTRVVPRRLTESGFTFQFPELEPALRHALD